MMKRAFSKTLVGLVKVLLLSRRCDVVPLAGNAGRPLVIMGNGPSLRGVIEHEMDVLERCDCMAVNFSANTPEFFAIRPRYYTMADPHFYRSADDANVKALIDNLNRVDWPMTVFMPRKAVGVMRKYVSNGNVSFARYNAVGVEGCRRFVDFVFDHRLGMPRPRNVLIPSIMVGAWLGYKELYLVGADHSWTQNLSVDEDNRVITNLPHYYADNEHENERVKAVYADVPLHSLFLSYYVAFKSYHEIEAWARGRGISIYNATRGSFIDAFSRGMLPK